MLQLACCNTLQHQTAAHMNIRFQHNGALYVFPVRAILEHLPGELIADALRRGKAYKRRLEQAERESSAAGYAAVSRDRMFDGDLSAF